MGLFDGLLKPNVQKLSAKGDVNGLIRALDYQKDWLVCYAAAEALGKLADARATEPLIAALNGKDKYIRKNTAIALGKIGDARAAEPLIAALDDENEEVREAAANALEKIGDARATEPLIAALNGGYRVSRAAARALGKMGWEPDAGESGARYWIIKNNWKKCIDIGEPAIVPLIEILNDDDMGSSAGYALGKIGLPAVEPLIAILNDKKYANHKYTHQRTAGALGEIGDLRAVEPLIALLRNGDREGRRSAAGALGKIGAAQTVDPLIEALRDEVVREAAVTALGMIGASAVKPLISALRDKTVCDPAADALEKTGWKPDYGEDGAWYWIIKKDWKKCAAIGAPAVEPLLSCLMGEDMNMTRNSAETLKIMYHSGKLDSRATQQILALQNMLEKSHADRVDNCDYHTDYGIRLHL
jgi:HEAT repeat protein